jgi:hypothetical protein
VKRDALLRLARLAVQIARTQLRGITYNLYRAVQLGLSSHRLSYRAFKAAA